MQENYFGPTTTAKSLSEGRLKVGVSEKKKIIKKKIKKITK